MHSTSGQAVKTIDPSLKDSELRYRRLFEAAQHGILILDAETGAITDVNPFLIKMLGYTREEFLSKKLWEVVAFKDMEASKDAFQALQKEKYIRYEDLPLTAKNGHLLQVEFVSNVYSAGDQKVIQCNIRDITVRKRAEDALRQREHQMHVLVSSLDDLVIELDEQGTYLNVWTGNTSLLARARDEMLGRSASAILGPELSRRVLEASARALVSGRSEDLEYPLEVIGGQRWFSAHMSPIPALEGGAATVCMLIRDITERKRAEQALKESDEQYRQIVDTAQEGVWTLDADNRTTLANKRLADMLGYTIEEMMGKSIFEFLDEEGKAITATSLENRRNGIDEQLDFKFTRKDGSTLWALMGTSALLGRNHEYIGALAMLTDITKRKRTEDALLQSEAELREQSVRDHLTGLFNRRYMEATLERELRRAARKDLALGVIMLDVDGFKGFNDTWGHAAGDAVLQELGKLLLGHVRGDDIPCRYGGDEFLIVLPDASREMARERAECLCEYARDTLIQFEGQTLPALTLTMGVASFPENGDTGEAVLKAADDALYRAKGDQPGSVVVAD